VGKTTLALQAAARLEMPHTFASADQPSLRGRDWIGLEEFLLRDPGHYLA
jgi:hypothetical protein